MPEMMVGTEQVLKRSGWFILKTKPSELADRSEGELVRGAEEDICLEPL